MSTLVKVIREKQAHAERFCPAQRCFWRTSKLNHQTGQRGPGGYCPRHRPKFSAMDVVRTAGLP